MHLNRRIVATYSPMAPTQRLSTMGRVFLAILIVALFEGALRKWLSPSLTIPLILLRDSLAAAGIIWAVMRGQFRPSSQSFRLLLAWTSFLILWGLVQLLINQNSPLAYMIGLRFWLLYLWFAIAAAQCLTRHDFRIIARALMLALILTTPLIILQFYSPPGAFINRQVDGDEDKVFRLTADFVRTTGLFSFTAGQATFLALVTPFVLASLSGSNHFWKSRPFPIAAFLTLGLCTMLSGSRAALAMFIIIFTPAILLQIYSAGRKQLLKNILIALMGLGIAVSIPLLLPSALDATIERITSANESESLVDRLLSMFLGEPSTYDHLTFLGHGLGMGSNFIGQLAGTQFALGETEAARVHLEGGLAGFLLSIIKVIFLGLTAWKALRIAWRYKQPLPLLLWIPMAIGVLTWSLIGQLTANVLGCLLIGLELAALRFAGNKS